MPAHINYETTPIIFYKFVCEDPEIISCYVGHTTNFNRRKTQHKFRCTTKNTNYDLKIYKTIRENGGWDKWKMVEIGRQICLDNSDACKIEQKYIENLQANMNMHFAFRTKQQYYFDNKEYFCELQKKYRIKNKEKITTKQSEHFDCECGGKYTYRHKSRHLKSLKHKEYCETIDVLLII